MHTSNEMTRLLIHCCSDAWAEVLDPLTWLFFLFFFFLLYFANCCFNNCVEGDRGLMSHIFAGEVYLGEGERAVEGLGRKY